MTIFVETSVQINRLLSSKKQRQQIESLLRRGDLTFVTSDYVFMEYQRTLISDFAHVHESFRQVESMGEAMTRLFSGQRRFRTRSLVRCGQIMSVIYGNRPSVDVSEMTDELALYLQTLLHLSFWRHITRLPDSIHCDLVAAGVQQQENGQYIVADRCRKEQASCHLPIFLEQNKDKLGQIIAYLKSHPNAIKDQERVTKVLERIDKNPEAALGQQSCWVIGDVIIALQIPDNCSVWSIDKDFVALAQALGLKQFSQESKEQ